MSLDYNLKMVLNYEYGPRILDQFNKYYVKSTLLDSQCWKFDQVVHKQKSSLLSALGIPWEEEVGCDSHT